MHTRHSASRLGAFALGSLVAAASTAMVSCGADEAARGGGASEASSTPAARGGSATGTRGREVFRYATYGDEQLWTDRLRMHEVIATAVDPTTALAVGLKVDVDAVPPEVLAGADMHDPATTVALIGMNAVVGVMGRVDAEGRLTEVGITCALCHSTVDDSFARGIGHRLDGWPNRDLDPGLIISLSPALTETQRAAYRSWGPGRYDPRFNIDGINAPVLIPPAYGLAGVALETYTGDGPISYWNAYVAVTQMGGRGDFSDPRIGVFVDHEPDVVTPRLPELLAYQLSLPKPAPPAGSFDATAAARGREVFTGRGRCASCHQGTTFTDADTTLHLAAETGMEAGYAARSATGRYRTTPLRALWQHAPYFHDGSAPTLAAVVEHYNAHLRLRLTAAQKADLVEYLKSL